MIFIEARDLRKVYRLNIKQPGLKGALRSLVKTKWEEKAAIDGISFTMEEGESLACIGENGAGKSTLIKMLVGILNPTSGHLAVYGEDPMRHHEAYLRKIGVIFGQKTNLWWDIPVIESYNAIRVLYKLDAALFEKNMRMVTELLDLEPILRSPARRLSLGQRMKADIGLVFLHSPKALYLDEPTIGLDINVKFAIRQFIRRMNKEEGVSVLLTSHDLDDIEQISDNALVLSKGKVFYRGSLDKLKESYGSARNITVTGELRAGFAENMPGVAVSADGLKTTITYDVKEYTSARMIEAISAACDIRDITIEEPRIDQVVSRIFSEGAGR
jgi:ABC-2 type transport system ATP-binding protein